MSQARPSSVLDALIATKWYLNDEEYTAEAQQLLTGFGEGIITLFAPDHIRYEVGNALWRAVQRDRFDVEFSRQALAGFLTLGVHTIGSNALIRAAFDLAVQYGCTLYNGLYLALAADSGLSLVHADLRLHNILAGRFAHELWIEDYDQGV